MRFELCFVAGFVAAIAAREATDLRHIHVANHTPRDLPSVKRSIQALSKELGALNKEVKGITSSNAATQLSSVNKQLSSLGATLVDQSKKLGREIASSDALSLLNSKTANEWLALGTDLASNANSVLTGLQSKRDLIKSSGKGDILSEGFHAAGKGFMTYTDALITTQLPAAIKTPLGIGGKNGKGPAFGTEQALIDKTVNNFIDQGINYLKGTQEIFTVPSDILPPGLTITYAPGAASGGTAPKAAGGAKGKGGKGKKRSVD